MKNEITDLEVLQNTLIDCTREMEEMLAKYNAKGVPAPYLIRSVVMVGAAQSAATGSTRQEFIDFCRAAFKHAVTITKPSASTSAGR